MTQAAQPFKRFHSFMSAIAPAAIAQDISRQEALLLQPAYQSRGHGLSRPNRKGYCVAMAQRAAKKARNIKRHRKACKG